MHKKISFTLVFLLMLSGMSSCGFLSEKKVEGAEGALSYNDPEIDISIVIAAPGWAYSKDEEAGMVVFYEPEDYDGLSNFAISANTENEEGTTDGDLSEAIDYMAEATRTNLTAGVESLEWDNAGYAAAGQYEAERYTYSGVLKSTGGKIRGDYFYWWTDERLYICSFITFAESYESYFEIILDSLETFKIYKG